ncbi:MAG: iron-containing alcohol dehydrogenase [Clostridia bacterium]|nr:iron-containing alcohol dehydrogenase [Clostridia bacterium]
MNCIKKAYCRTYQTVFRAALPILPYRDPKLLDSTDELPSLLRKKKIKSVLLVTDKSIRELGITRHLEKALRRAGIKCAVYDKTVANPTTVNVEEARELYIREKCRAVIGFGGGSSIDCAKAVGARIAKPKQSLAQMKGILKVHKRLPMLIAIPTTAGTGSETTLAAVITDAKTRHKYPINDFPLIPHYAVLDPEVTRSLPKSVTAQTGMDALTHAVEAYIGRSTTRETRADATEAVRLIFENIFDAYENGDNMRARRNMLHASFLAGSAFSKSYVGYVHAVAHSLGGRYNTPHGLANAVLLPFVLESYGESAHKKLHDLAIVIGISDKNESHAAGAEKFIDAVKDMKKRLGIPDTIKGIKAKDVPRLAHYADKEANPLYPVPKLMDANELKQFYYMIME